MTTITPPGAGSGTAAAAATAGSSSFLPLDTLFSNPLFAGGLGLASLGYAATLARRVAIRSGALLKRRLLVSLEVSKNDDAERKASANLNTGEPFETLTLTTLYAHRHVFEDLFGEAYALSAKAGEDRTPVLSASGTGWAPFGEARRKRPLGSVILDKGVAERVLDDVRDRGQRGSGMSRGGFRIDGVISSMGRRGVGRTILLLEDADAAFVERKGGDGGWGGVTFSGLLNALDGVAAGEERVVFLTTNWVGRLDEALVRPGRVDVIECIGSATEWQAGELWDRFYGGEAEEEEGVVVEKRDTGRR
ncbi:hypothetical protein VE04_09898, partial [Pseudogymnoascus sp. 24MN13]